jgi:hypothetical protein|tara:strand:- start:514 stop:768 length:255 start_codon:yes stop_codon:yes gene_type:complete
MVIIIDKKGEHQSPKITIDTKDCHYPYAIKESIELALKLDGHEENMIREIFGRSRVECDGAQPDEEPDEELDYQDLYMSLKTKR